MAKCRLTQLPSFDQEHMRANLDSFSVHAFAYDGPSLRPLMIRPESDRSIHLTSAVRGLCLDRVRGS